MITVCTILGYNLSLIELLGSIFTIISVLFATYENKYTWISSILGVICYGIIYFNTGLYPDVVLQLFYLYISFKGLQKWFFQKLTIKNLPRNYIKYSLYTSIILTFFLFNISFLFSNNYLILLFNSISSSLSIIATVLLVYKKYETWYFWILVNIICIIVYFFSGLYLISIVYIILLINAIFALYKWNNYKNKNLC